MRPRGKKPQPTHLKLIKGSNLRRVNREEAIVPPGIPDPPDHLGEEARLEWDRICDDLYTAGILTKIDRAILALYCDAYGRWVTAVRLVHEMARKEAAILGDRQNSHGLIMKTIKGNVIQNPMVGIANKAAVDCARFATDLGLTPSARSRVKAVPSGGSEIDPADRYFG